MASLSSRRDSPQNAIQQGLSLVPSSLTAVTSADSVIYQITVSNVDSGAHTLLVQDQQATPGILVPTISIPANTVIIMEFPEGILMKSGIKWQASAANDLWSEIYGFVANSGD